MSWRRRPGGGGTIRRCVAGQSQNSHRLQDLMKTHATPSKHGEAFEGYQWDELLLVVIKGHGMGNGD